LRIIPGNVVAEQVFFAGNGIGFVFGDIKVVLVIADIAIRLNIK
jgi:hypothetical protein